MDGQQLVSDYQTAMVTAATANAAQYEANRSESDLLGHLDAMSSGRFLQPGAIADTDQADITRSSLDAHFKKVQASQLGVMSAAQLQTMTEQDQATYHGRRVQVLVKSKLTGIIELVSFDQQRGYTSSLVNRRTISGVIDTIVFEKNLLVIRPTLRMRLLNSRLQHYLIYVIDPETFTPLVSLQVS